MGPLRRLSRGDELSESEIRDLWKLRLTLCEVADPSLAEQDWEWFLASHRCRDRHLVRYFDRDRLAGLFSTTVARRTHEGRPYVSFEDVLLYLDPKLRRRNDYARWGFSLVLKAYLRYGLTPKFLMASLFLPGYLACRSFHPRVWSLHSPGLASWERGILEGYARRQYGERWDAERRLLRYQVRPRRSPSEAARWLQSPAAAEYLSVCPEWEQGLVTVFMVPLGLGNFVFAIRKALRRVLRRGRRGAVEPEAGACPSRREDDG